MLCGCVLLPAGLFASEYSEWHLKMQPISPLGYLCRHTGTPIVIDGKLDDAAWANAPWTSDFVDIEGSAKPKPRFRTRAKLMWDDEYLYIAAELEEPHVWGTLTNHDAVIFYDPDFEVFIDPDGDTHRYYEFEMNALNTTWDLRLPKPYQDQGKPEDGWEIPGAKTAVHIHGTINNPADTDQGWTIEIAFPWKVLSEHARHAGPPDEGEQWRIDFSRVEWQIGVTNGGYQKLPKTPENNWIWSPPGVVDMHRPEMWGRLQFTRGNSVTAVAEFPGAPARKFAFEIYYAQRDFWKANNRYATNLIELPIAPKDLPPEISTATVSPTTDGYVAAVTFKEAGRVRAWRIRQDRLLKLDEPLPVETESFVSEATEKFGEVGRRAAYFLVDNMPASDRAALTREFLLQNLALALQARTNFPWAAAVPERLYFNDVLPYASLDEPRDPWRNEFYPLAAELVRDCKTATEAAQALNREIFKRLNVHYNLGRKRNNQSPKESIEQGKATCTGLSIILVDVCRAVGIPSRIVGVPEWAQKEGNHTWVEIWDGDWFFTGADEYDEKGLNRGWFNNDAALTARSSNSLNQVYASSWRRTGDYFPLAWDFDSRDVPAVNVSARYAALAVSTNDTATVVHVRLREKTSGERLVATVEFRGTDGRLIAQDRTRAGTADLNDMPAFTLPKAAKHVIFRFVHGAEAREAIVPCVVCLNTHTLDFVWSELAVVAPEQLAAEAWFAKPAAERGTPPALSLGRAAAERVVALAWEDVKRRQDAAATAELAAKEIVIGDKKLKWWERTFGDAPDGKHSLWITMHGGGQGTEEDNDRNWKGYFGRYEFPPGSINVAPRAPANTWDMWHVPWVDDLFDRLIADYVIKRNVDPARIYLIGYSAGGDGVYQLAPRMADRFSAAAMCAGHQNEITPEGLRNLPFFLYMGGADDAYHRNTVVREFSSKLDTLQAADPDGYLHRLTVYPGLPHNMQGREAEAIPRMAALTRTAWPKRVVWKQDGDAPHARLYWLAVTNSPIDTKPIVSARVSGQTITLESPASGNIALRLSDALLDLDQPIQIEARGKNVFAGKVPRTINAVLQSLRERNDPETVATALLPVKW
jgi:transglutaminase-like putative cysteine protease/dienelactone hydrolase